MDNHQKFTIAVPTRNRRSRVERFIESLYDTTREEDRPQVLFIHDNPTANDSVSYVQGLDNTTSFYNSNKSSLTKLWNQCIVMSQTPWTLVCNDDAVFKDGWFDYLCSTIMSNRFLQINLLHYGGFCIHKRMVLRNGWFDERFKGGGFEDNDWQLRLYESELKPLVDISHDFKFMDHLKYSDGTNWLGENNEEWILKKWCRKDLYNWRIPSFRRAEEVDWYPGITRLYEESYSEKSRIPKINKLVGSDTRILH